MLLERLVDSFNRGAVEEVVSDVTDDYSYLDPTSGPLDRDSHLALMHQVLTMFPDRRVTLHATGAGDDVEFGEARWEGTPADGGERVIMTGAVVLDLRDGRLRAQRWYFMPR